MSLEKKIEELTEAIELLIAKLGDASVASESQDTPAPKKKAPPKKKGNAKKKAPPVDDDDDDDDDAPPPKKTRAKKINYEKDVKPKVLEAIATPAGRESFKELLEEYEVKNAKLVPDDAYPELLKAVDAIIEENDED